MLEHLSLPRMVEPVLDSLAKKAESTVALGIISEDRTFVLAQFEGAPGIGVSAPIGHVTPVTYGAHGKIIAAFLPENELSHLLKRTDLWFYGNPQKFDAARFENEIKQCRADGFAFESGDLVPGVNAIAAPLLDHLAKPIGYITIVGFFDASKARQLGGMAVEAARQIARETDHLVSWKSFLPGYSSTVNNRGRVNGLDLNA